MKDEATILLTVSAGTAFVFLARIVSEPTDALKRPGAMLRITLGGSIVIVGLLLAYRIAPKPAVFFSWVFLAGTVLTYGQRVAPAITKTLGQEYRVPETRGTDYGDPSGRSADLNDWTGQRSAYWGSGSFPTNSFGR